MENEMGKYPAPPTKEEKRRMRLGKQRIRTAKRLSRLQRKQARLAAKQERTARRIADTARKLEKLNAEWDSTPQEGNERRKKRNSGTGGGAPG